MNPARPPGAKCQAAFKAVSASTWRRYIGLPEQGSLKSTDNAFDLAIQGKGYFQVQLPNGETAYTRDGTFQVNEAGALVTHDGFEVLPGISIPTDAVDITINSTGEVLVKQDGTEQPANVGSIQLAIFANEGGLRHEGNNLFTRDRCFR